MSSTLPLRTPAGVPRPRRLRSRASLRVRTASLHGSSASAAGTPSSRTSSWRATTRREPTSRCSSWPSRACGTVGSPAVTFRAPCSPTWPFLAAISRTPTSPKRTSRAAPSLRASSPARTSSRPSCVGWRQATRRSPTRRLAKARLEDFAARATDCSHGRHRRGALKRVAFDDVRFAGTSFFRTSLAGIDLTACQLADIVLSDAMGELSGCTMGLYQAAGIARRLGVVVKD